MAWTDNEIIERIRRGEKHRYAQLVDRYKDKAMTLGRRMLKDRLDAEEAAQDAFLRAYNGLEKFEGSAKFSTWFYRILYNACLTRLRRRKTEFQPVEYDDDREYEGQWERGSETPLSILESADLGLFVKRAIDDMPMKYGTILSLYYLQELSHSEICEVTALPLGTVKVQLFRARAMLQERLTNELQPEKVAT